MVPLRRCYVIAIVAQALVDQEYVLIAQDSPRIEHYVRQANGTWHYAATIGLESLVEMPSINCTLALADVYENINFAE